MRRSEPCAHLRPDYDRLEVAHRIIRDPITDEISWEVSGLEDELRRLGLIGGAGGRNCTHGLFITSEPLC